MKIIVPVKKGGPGSGNWGHAGRPGSVGGSAPKTGVGAAMSIRTGRTAAERQAAARSTKRDVDFRTRFENARKVSENRIPEGGVYRYEELDKLDFDYNDHVEGLNDDEYKAVRVYTGSNYRNINKSLRETGECCLNNDLDLHEQMRLTRTAKNLEKATRRETIKEDLVVYRGTRSDSLLQALDKGFIEEGDVLKDNGFLSTSPSFTTAKGFSSENIPSVFFNILAPKGVKALYLGNNSVHSSEREFLFPPGTRLKIHSISKKVAPWKMPDRPQFIYTIDAEIYYD